MLFCVFFYPMFLRLTKTKSVKIPGFEYLLVIMVIYMILSTVLFGSHLLLVTNHPTKIFQFWRNCYYFVCTYRLKLAAAKLNTDIHKQNREELKRRQKEISWIAWTTRGSFDHCINQALNRDIHSRSASLEWYLEVGTRGGLLRSSN